MKKRYIIIIVALCLIFAYNVALFFSDSQLGPAFVLVLIPFSVGAGVVAAGITLIIGALYDYEMKREARHGKRSENDDSDS